MKFKQGDKVIFYRNANEYSSYSHSVYKINQILTIKKHYQSRSYLNLWVVEEGKCVVYENEIELADVYNSPLYQALREDEEKV